MGDKELPTKRIEARVVYEIDQDIFDGAEVESLGLTNRIADWMPLYDLEVEILSISDSTYRYDRQVED